MLKHFRRLTEWKVHCKQTAYHVETAAIDKRTAEQCSHRLVQNQTRGVFTTLCSMRQPILSFARNVRTLTDSAATPSSLREREFYDCQEGP